MTPRQLPDWHSTFSANADVAACTVHARGELELLTLDLLAGTIDVLIRAGQHRITLDLADVTGVDAAGVKLLVALQHSLATHDGELTIINSRPQVRDALEPRPARRPGPNTTAEPDVLAAGEGPLSRTRRWAPSSATCANP